MSRHFRCRGPQLLALVFLGLALPRLADAQPGPAGEKGRAKLLLDEGVGRYSRGDWQGALDQFEAAYRAYPSYKILLNLGGALRKLGRDPEAAEAYEQYLEGAARERQGEGSTGGSSGDRMERAARESEQRVEAVLIDLRRRLGMLRVAVEPRDAQIAVDGLPRTLPMGRALYISPGPHTIEAKLGSRSATRIITIAAGEAKPVELVVHAEAEPPPPAPPVAPPLPAPAPTPELSSSYTKTWIAAGVAGGLLIGGLAVGWHARSVYDDYAAQARAGDRTAEQRLDQANSEGTAATVLFAGAGAAAITAAVFYFWERGEPRRAALVHPVALPTGIALGGRF